MKTYIALLILSLPIISHSQITLKGEVRDSEGEQFIAATILIKGTTSGTITDFDGHFSILVDSLPRVLAFSYTGYDTQEVLVEDTSFLSIVLSYVTAPCYVRTPIDNPIPLGMAASYMKLFNRQLQRDNDIFIAPSLNQVPGLDLQSGSYNMNHITIRGIGNRSVFSRPKARIYVDEIPFAIGIGETTMEDIGLSVVEKIDVWKGPSASPSGANLGGMLHLKTHVLEYPFYTESNFISSKVTLGSYGLFRNDTSLFYSNKKRTASFRVNYNNTHSDGYRQNSTYDRQGATIVGKIRGNKANRTTILANFNDVKSFNPGGLNENDFDESPRIANDNWANVKGFEEYEKVFLGISHQNELIRNRKFKLINRTAIFSNFRETYDSRPSNILDQKHQSFGFRTSIEFHHPSDENFDRIPKLSIGIESFRENNNWQTFVTNDGVQGELISDNFQQKNNTSLFIQSHHSIWNDWNIITGINLSRSHYEYEDRFIADAIDLSGGFDSHWILSPRVGVSHILRGGFEIFTTVSRGVSMPSLTETLMPLGTINLLIKPETAWNFEIGHRGKWGSKFRYELTLYQMQIENMLIPSSVGMEDFIHVNVGEARHSGIDFFAQYRAFKHRDKLIASLSYAYKHYRFLDFIEGGNDYFGNKVPGTRPNHLNIGIDFKIRSVFYGNINYQLFDAFPLSNDNLTHSNQYQLTNFKVGYKRHINYSKFRINVHVGIQNVFNEKYAGLTLINARRFGGNSPMQYYPGLARNLFGGVEIKMNLVKQ